MIFEKQEFVISPSLGQQNGGADDGDDASPQGGTAGKVRGPSVQDQMSPAARPDQGEDGSAGRQEGSDVPARLGGRGGEPVLDCERHEADEGPLPNPREYHRTLVQRKWNKARG